MADIIEGSHLKKTFLTIKESTLEYDCCIGCGFCGFVCPQEAISFVRDRYNEFKPKINNSRCLRCRKCVIYCPMQRERLENVAKEIALSSPHSFGIQKADYWVGFDKNLTRRVQSASGGIVTFLASKMLKCGQVDAVIHAEAVAGKIGSFHYRTAVSYSPEEVERRRGSFYQFLNYKSLLSEIAASKKRNFLFIGTPCIISGMKKLFSDQVVFKGRKLYTVALACSHNVNSQYVSFLAEAAHISPSMPFKANLRAKDLSEINADNFHTRFLGISDNIIYSKNRYHSYFTSTWRNYFFAKNACSYCPDFWGYEADLSVKDAWGKWSQEDNLGKSIVVLRNESLRSLLIDGELELVPLSFSEIQSSQLTTTTFKHENAQVKLGNSVLSLANIRNGLFRYRANIKISKYLYSIFGFRALQLFLLLFNRTEYRKLDAEYRQS